MSQLHFHVLVTDGAFNDDGVFVADEAPNDDDVRRIMVRAGRRVMSADRSSFTDTNGPADNDAVGLVVVANERADHPSSTNDRAPPLKLVSGNPMHAVLQCLPKARPARPSPPA